MLKHMEDGSELNILIDDGGNLIAVCSKCKKIWTGKLALSELTSSRNKNINMISSFIKINPLLFKELNVDAKIFTRSILK